MIVPSIDLMNGWTVKLTSATQSLSDVASLKLAVVRGRFLVDNFKALPDMQKYTDKNIIVESGVKYFNPTFGKHSLLIRYVELPRDIFFGQETIKIPNHGMPLNDKLYIFQVGDIRYYMTVLNENLVCVFAIHEDLVAHVVESAEEAAEISPPPIEKSDLQNSPREAIHIETSPPSEEATKIVMISEKSQATIFDDNTSVVIFTVGVLVAIVLLSRASQSGKKRKMNRGKVLNNKGKFSSNKRRFIRK